jgi:lactoylglutathione lyase
MMKIDHVALWTPDLEAMKKFYMKYFNMECGEKYVNEMKGFSSYFLSFGTGARIEIMHRKDISAGVNSGDSVGLTHFAISVGSKENVNELTEWIRRDGIEIFGESRTTGDGYYESVVSDPDGNHVEITV